MSLQYMKYSTVVISTVSKGQWGWWRWRCVPGVSHVSAAFGGVTGVLWINSALTTTAVPTNTKSSTRVWDNLSVCHSVCLIVCKLKWPSCLHFLPLYKKILHLNCTYCSPPLGRTKFRGFTLIFLSSHLSHSLSAGQSWSHILSSGLCPAEFRISAFGPEHHCGAARKKFGCLYCENLITHFNMQKVCPWVYV